MCNGNGRPELAKVTSRFFTPRTSGVGSGTRNSTVPRRSPNRRRGSVSHGTGSLRRKLAAAGPSALVKFTMMVAFCTASGSSADDSTEVMSARAMRTKQTRKVRSRVRSPNPSSIPNHPRFLARKQRPQRDSNPFVTAEANRSRASGTARVARATPLSERPPPERRACTRAKRRRDALQIALRTLTVRARAAV